jgi:hypothetical protein
MFFMFFSYLLYLYFPLLVLSTYVKSIHTEAGRGALLRGRKKHTPTLNKQLVVHNTHTDTHLFPSLPHSPIPLTL